MHLIQALPPLEAFLWGALAMAALGLLLLFTATLLLLAWIRLATRELPLDPPVTFGP